MRSASPSPGDSVKFKTPARLTCFRRSGGFSFVRLPQGRLSLVAAEARSSKSCGNTFWTTMTLLLLYYIRRSRPEDQAIHESTSIAMAVIVLLAIIFLVVSLAWRRFKQSPLTGNR